MKTRAPGYSIGQFKPREKDATPGPGEYYNPQIRFKGHYIGTSKRKINMHPENNPGPGQYRVTALVGDVPNYAL